MLTRSDIDDILRLIDGSDFLELKLEIGDLKLEVRRPGAAATTATVPTSVAAPLPVAAPVKTNAPVGTLGSGTAVPAPLLGIFWLAARPGADAFVKPGDRVTPDTVIGIIEVMKLMTSVPAGLAGVVLDLSAPNGQMVEHGQTLIRILPD